MRHAFFAGLAVALVAPLARADDAPPARFTTHANHAAIVDAACAYRAREGNRPVDVSVDGHRCAFGLVPAGATALEVHVAGDVVTIEGQVTADTMADARAKIEDRLRFGDDYHANTYVVSKQVPRSGALRDAGLIVTTLGVGSLLVSPWLAVAAAWHPLDFHFCIKLDNQPCPAKPPPDTSGLVAAAAITAVAGVVLLTLGVVGFSVGRTKIALVSASGGALTIAF